MEQLNVWLIFTLALIVPLGISAAYVPWPRLDGRIVGGYEADIKDISFQVSLQGGYHFCGGSLIAKRFVLTAAHCTAGHSTENPSFKVRIGSKYSAKDGILLKPIRIHQHKQYSATNIDYDFSILELEEYELDSLSFEIQFAKLPTSDVIKDGTTLTVSGWGNTQNSSESSDVLRAVKVPKVNEDVCVSAYADFGGITERMICAGMPEGGKDACQGDSGGPLFRKGTLVGVVSWGYGCAKPNYPGVYSRVSSVLPWITETTGIEAK